MKGKYDVWDNKQYELPLLGKWGDEYKIRVNAGKIKNLGAGVEIIGDFKKFYNSGNEDAVFTFGHFIESVQKLLSLFPAGSEQVHVINLEPSIEFQIPGEWNVQASAIINNILRFKGKYNYRQDKDSEDNGYHLQFALTEYLYHIKTGEDKDSSEGQRSMSIGMEIRKSAYLKDRGITLLSDLLNYQNHQLLLTQVAELFNHLIIYQDEADEQLLLIEEGIYCREYNRKQAWNKLHNDNPDKYKYMKSKLETVIERVCSVCYKLELQKIIYNKLNATGTTAPTVGVPDFPLYMEKQEMPYTTTIPFAA